MQVDPLKHLNVDVDHVITLDFESFYDTDYTLTKMTNEGYVRDERFETIGVGVKVDYGQTYWTDHDGFRRWAAGINWKRTAALAHHAHFDGLILAHHYGISPRFWFDTLSMARALHGVEVGNSLAKLSTYYGAGEKGHEVLQAKGKRRRDFTQEEFDAYGGYCRNDVDLTRNIFDQMIANGFPELELWSIDTTVRMFTEPCLRLNEQLLHEFLTYEQKRKAELLSRVEQEKGTISSSAKFAELLRSRGVDPPMKRSPATGLPIPAFAKSDPGMQALLEHQDEEIRWLAEARIGIRSTINETRTGRFLSCGRNGRPFTIYLNYAKAHTFRWAGGDKMNPQNLERVPPKPDPEKPYAGTLRKALLAPPGKELAVADSNAIEARVLAWLAGHTTLVEAFAQQRKVYEEFASAVYGRKIDYKKNPETDTIPRLVGKTAILGLGYQMGWAKFAQALAAGPMGEKSITFKRADAEALGVDVDGFAMDPAAVLHGAENLPGWMKAKVDRWRKVEAMPSRLPMAERLVHCAVAHFLVQKYRAENEPIVQLWKQMEQVLHWMVDGVETAFAPNDCCRTVRHGIVLPSGLVMRYPGLKRTEEVDEETGRSRVHFSYIAGHAKEKTHIYGGLLTENLTQALARQVIAEQLLEARGRYGYHAVTTTHDEIVLCTDAAEAQQATERLIEVMKTPPAWATGLPLNAEGDHAVSYGEAK
jgi:hypothetical protein